MTAGRFPRHKKEDKKPRLRVHHVAPHTHTPSKQASTERRVWGVVSGSRRGVGEKVKKKEKDSARWPPDLEQ